MKSTTRLITSALRPNTITRALSHHKASDAATTIRPEDIKITPLLPNDYDHFETFRKIITDERIVFTSSWIDKWFGVENLRQKCSHTKMKLQLIDEGDAEIALPEEVVEAHNRGVPPDKIALDRFFSLQPNKDKLREIYLGMTSRVAETGLGYYKFEDASDRRLLGGGSLAPISDGIPIEKVDIALHILDRQKGIGSICLKELLTKAFDECGVSQVVGSSLIDHPGTPTLCAKHGMVMKNQDNMKYYFISKKMWEANKESNLEEEMKSPKAASTHYGKGEGKGR
ncbi:MAG: hypothetical protein ISQ34_05395 [Rickettsiales bacterium]|nr:hypothetical protein [Rickettsiales bacterium]